MLQQEIAIGANVPDVALLACLRDVTVFMMTRRATMVGGSLNRNHHHGRFSYAGQGGWFSTIHTHPLNLDTHEYDPHLL